MYRRYELMKEIAPVLDGNALGSSMKLTMCPAIFICSAPWGCPRPSAWV